jgi:hypothetical protein
MPPPTDITMKEVDDAFYASYGEGTPKGLAPGLAGPGGVGRRKLSLDTTDDKFRACWMEVRRLLREKKGVCPVTKGAPLGSPVVACPAKVTKPDSPAYAPADWNDGGPVQDSTNCYAYAVDSRVGHTPGGKPQPGNTSGTATDYPVNCASTTAAVVKDGQPDAITQAPRCPYNQQEKEPPPEKPGYYLVALVQTSKPHGYDAVDDKFYVNDYHWYRQDDDGSWSHKPGHGTARNVDSAGAPISNPETAARRTVAGSQYVPAAKKKVDMVVDYDRFCGYFYVKKGGAPLAP